MCRLVTTKRNMNQLVSVKQSMDGLDVPCEL
jgi:hypothetical protein